MASSGPKHGLPTMDEMAKQLQQLQIENKELKKRLRQSPGIEKTDMLTPSQKEAMIVSAVSALSSVASRKIEAKVRNKVNKAITKEEAQSIISSITLRIDVSMEESKGGTARRGRAASRHRVSDD